MALNNVTIKEVAAYCHVSIATVSRVLNGNYYVSPELKQKVLNAVKELHYVPNYMARTLKMHTSGVIGYITSDISNSYHIAIAKAIEDCITPYNYNLIVCSTSNNAEIEQRHLKLLLGRNVDALIINTCGHNDSIIMDINRTVPMVLVNRRLNTPGFHGDFSDCNNTLGMYLLTKNLLANGHRKIYLVEGPEKLSNTLERYIGFEKAMTEYDIDISKEKYLFYYRGDYSSKSGYNSVKAMMALPEQPTAILTTNNAMMIGVLKCLNEFNISIPEQISVSCFNGIENIELMSIRPTIADFSPYLIGKAAGRSILERIKDNSIENREYIFAPTLIHGNGVRKLSKN